MQTAMKFLKIGTFRALILIGLIMMATVVFWDDVYVEFSHVKCIILPCRFELKGSALKSNSSPYNSPTHSPNYSPNHWQNDSQNNSQNRSRSNPRNNSWKNPRNNSPCGEGYRFPAPIFLNITDYHTKIEIRYSQPVRQPARVRVAKSKWVPLKLDLSVIQHLYPGCPHFIDGDKEITVKDVVFVTCSSSNHFKESFDAVASIQKYFPKSPIIYYDMGLEPEEIKQVKSWCSVEYRKFNFDIYPDHVRNLFQYGWKAIIIQEVLWYSKAVLWFDASIRFSTGDISRVLKRAKACGGYILLSRTYHSIYAVTAAGFYNYLPSNLRKLAQTEMYEANFQIILNTNFVYNDVMIWYLACSLNENCISPPGSQRHCEFKSNPMKYYANCHRYDQTAINVILTNLFHYRVGRYIYGGKSVASIERQPTSNYTLAVCPGNRIG